MMAPERIVDTILGTRVARSATLVGLVWAAASCADGLTDINTNPNAPIDVPAQLLLPQAIQNTAQAAFGAGQMLQHTGIWPQHFVQIQYPDEDRGQVRASRMEAYWTSYYSGGLKDVQLVMEKGSEAGDANIEGVGRIWKSWIFHVVTDLWGDVPYREALNGEENTVPVYDAQSDIYEGLFADLTTGASMVGSGTGDFGAGDLLYGNDFALWRKFANSLRMRLAMRLSEVDPERARAEFAAAFASGGFTSNADNAFLDYPGSPYENPLHENYLTRDDNGVSQQMIDILASLDDPRLALYAEPATRDGEYRGHRNGSRDLPVGRSLAWFSRIGDFWRADGAATPSAVMTYAEVLFLQAEAAARGWISGAPAELYMEAIEASMNLYDAYGPAHNPSDADIAAYLAQPEIAYTGMDDIHLQKWIALWMNGMEAWSNWRRTDAPALEPGPDLLISRIPIRFSYPDSEQSLNSANLEAAISRQGGGLELTTPVWWDVN